MLIMINILKKNEAIDPVHQQKRLKANGLTENEYKKIKKTLGREANDLEVALIGVMWSEHCSYKSTRPLLGKFPQSGQYVVQGPGENAGVVDLGEGWGLAFKVESHNHPSAVAPYQGAATGVGGIIRDILAMGARPAASMDGLFFGDPKLAKTKRLAEGIVAGVGGYGNAVGVPTVGGKTFYDTCYNDNPLVNAFSSGFVRLDSLASSKTAAPGQLAVLLGSKTGRDGIAGASFASKELDDDTKGSRPQIQIGDPFEEKLLIECCLDLLQENLIASMQDMGAAGILSSSSEVAHKSDCGLDIHCEKIPLREEMEPWEIFLSESQERMLLVVKPELLADVEKKAAKYGLDCAPVGHITTGDRYRVFKNGELLADLPVSILGDASIIKWPAAKPQDLDQRSQKPEFIGSKDQGAELLKLLNSANGHSKHAIWEQYDSQVQLGTVAGPGGPVAAVNVPETERLVLLAMEAEPRKCWIDPFNGAAEVMLKALRNLWVHGAEALGMSNCLNFASPEKAENFYELSECVKGLAVVCRDLECPVVSGNVSLYNETPQGAIYPTPLVVTAGLIPEREKFLPAGQTKEGDRIFLVGPAAGNLSGSRWQALYGAPQGPLDEYRLETEKAFCQKALATAKGQVARSARLIAGGGLAVTLALEAIYSQVGLSIITPQVGSALEILFGEGGPRAIYAVPSANDSKFREIWSGYSIDLLGLAEGTSLNFSGPISINISLEELSKAFKE